MQLLSTAFLVGSALLQTVLGRPERGPASRANILKRSVDSFIESETPYAYERLLCNFGADGCAASGALAGVVIASPSKSDPDYFYTWTRDAGLVLKGVVDSFTSSYDSTLQGHIQEYVISQAKLQGVSNPSGSLSGGSGLGEPKFNVDLTQFTGSWGRPQHDGPALRAIALVSYAKWLIDNGYESTASEVVWPVARNDLEYVAQYWNNTGFDLWEEVNGSSFFTTASQWRALVEGASLASTLGQTTASSKYSSIAPQILCFLQTFWIPEQGYVDANINVNDGRTGKDTNTVLASIHTFDPALGCDSTSFQPCSDRALSNLRLVVSSFRGYAINSGIATGQAIAVGRYSEDVYYDGNPWYLNTLSVAEQLYDAVYVWKAQGYITVTSLSLPFFQDLAPSTAAGTYLSGSTTFDGLVDAVSTYADGFVEVVSTYAGTDGALAEQYSKSDGTPTSAEHLTWSYSAFLTAVARRAGTVPPSWASQPDIVLPASCQKSTAVGSYTSATVTTFPGSLTATGTATGTTAGTATTTATTATSTKATSTSCVQATAVAVTFTVKAATQYGQTVKISGNSAELGSWDTSKAVALSASDYTASNPVWKGTVNLLPGESLQYKYINVASNGAVTWETGANRAYTVATGCSSTASQSDTWRP
ncbi:glucoamylase [Geosmithia morbida]|uniref:Glucoamylase n=1 Tax=Geosmithia morbida TaxID=1094350 RepID=A0A9P4YVW2_9HYPO|nr:glucoamylase [Geosmithia morbida]KAF4123810.1 glucoamylase [Geosmithia morbida]